MLQIWSLTPAKWQKAVKKFPHDAATPLTSFDPVAEAGVGCVELTKEELDTVNGIRPWIALAMDSWFADDFTNPACLDFGGDSECPCGTPGLWNTNW